MAMRIGYDTYGLLTVLTHYSSRKETFLSYVLTGFNPVVFVFDKVSLFFNEKPLATKRAEAEKIIRSNYPWNSGP